ncbi:MAG: hypothetical protein LBD53_02665 [Tannerella sp.]|jgi:ribosomal 30S subunit maturation factor RimM|nr:hypothetical protein [Tannerella sp.]
MTDIGHFTKPHGGDGELMLSTDYDIAEMFDRNNDFFIATEIDGIMTPFYIASCRNKNAKAVIIRFENVDTIYKAERLAGKKAFIRERGDEGSNYELRITKQRSALANYEMRGRGDEAESRKRKAVGAASGFLNGTREQSILGYTVITDNNIPLGIVKYIEDSTANVLLVIENIPQTINSQAFIPLPFITGINNSEQTITVSLPEGFLEI